MSRVAHIMTPAPATISASATAADAAALMQRMGLRHLPVVDDGGRLVGILSDRDLRGPMIGVDRPAQPIDRLPLLLGVRLGDAWRLDDPLHRHGEAEVGRDLIVLDAHMPEMDGFTLAERLRDDPRAAAVPKIMLSSGASRGDA